jgi:O-antigen/teichoic acid export membrane protein
VLAVPIAVGCIALAGPLMVAVYGEPFETASGAFTVLMVGEFAFFFGAVLVAALIGLGQAKRALALQAIVVPLNIAACAALIPAHGYHAAAVVTAVTEVFVALALARELRRRLEHPNWFVSARTAMRTVLASAVMLAALLLGRSAGWPVGALVALGAVAYAVAALALGVLRRRELVPVLPAIETSDAGWARAARAVLRP